MHGPQTGAPSNVGVAHRVHRPAARRAAYVSRSDLRRSFRQPLQLDPPSTGRPRAAADATSRGPSRVLALPAALAGLPPFGRHRFAPVQLPRVAGPGVSLPVAAALAFAAAVAQAPVRLVRMAPALAAEPACDASIGAVPGTAVLGLAGFRIPDPLGSGRPPFGGAGPVGIAAFLGTGIADRAPGCRCLPAAARTETSRQALGGSPARSLALELAPPLGICIGHGVLPAR